jgi:L,D-transpeptidase YcbB
MRRGRLDVLLTSAAVALALSVSGPAAFALTNAQIEAAVPVPDTAPLPPPTLTDISPAAGASKPASAAAKPTDASQAPVVTGTVEPAAAPAVSGDAAIAEKLRELAAGRYDRIVGGKKERTGIETFYGGRNFAPLWITDGAMNERAKAVASYLARVEADGLEPEDYPIPQFKAGAEPEALAEAELKLTQTVLTFARHAQTGRVHYSRVATDIAYELARPEPADVLAKLAGTSDVRGDLDSFHPPHAGYKALKVKLAEARGIKDPSKPRIGNGPVLRIGKNPMHDARVPLLRERLGVAGDTSDTIYDKAVADAVTKFQREHDLPATGQLNSPTLQALNGPAQRHNVDLIVANMERWRWMPRDLGKTHVMVNIPEYTLRVIRDSKVVWSTRIVVGKPTQATPIMSAEMKFITVNPTWNVPPSIIQNEYLPALAADPDALSRIGLRVTYNADGTIRIYQPPGDRNALGRIRFNFPNKFLVYQHDTPDKHLFAHDKRAYSHGCMRVQDPLKYGEVLLSLVRPGEGYTQEKLRSMFGGAEININFPSNIPVHLTYQTAFVDDAGKLVTREDIYGRDSRLMVALKSGERRVADVPMDRPKSNSNKPVRMPYSAAYYGGGGGYGGGGFFDQLFGGPVYYRPPMPVSRTRAANANRRSYR